MSNLEHRVTLVPIASPLHDPEMTSRVLSSYRKWLAHTCDAESEYATSADDIKESKLKEAAGLVCLVLTGGTEQILVAAAALRRPLLVLAHDSMNSLPAAIEAMSALPGHGVEMAIGKGTKQAAKVRAFARAARVLSRIGRHRIGLIGGPSPWLAYSLPDANALASVLGIKVVEIPMEEFRQTYELTSKGTSSPRMINIAASRESRGFSASDFTKSERIYQTLKVISKMHRLSAVSPRCFDFIKDFGATGCLALSRLNDEGTVGGCEGDVPSAVAMIALSETSGGPAFMGNPSFIEGHKLTLAHCTVATRLTKEIRFRTHFESGIGLALAGEFRRGARVTVARFAKGYSLLRAGGGILVKNEPWSEELCRTQAQIRMDGSADVFWKRPIGNHLVMTYGDHVGPLRQLASIAGIEFEEV